MVDVELIQLCVPYGPLSNYMMLKGKSQVGSFNWEDKTMQGSPDTFCLTAKPNGV